MPYRSSSDRFDHVFAGEWFIGGHAVASRMSLLYQFTEVGGGRTLALPFFALYRYVKPAYPLVWRLALAGKELYQ